MHLKVTIVSTSDKDSPHIMAFVFIVLHVPFFKTSPYDTIEIAIYLFVYVCISQILTLVFYSPVCI